MDRRTARGLHGVQLFVEVNAVSRTDMMGQLEDGVRQSMLALRGTVR
jgi:hypothetical protein